MSFEANPSMDEGVHVWRWTCPTCGIGLKASVEFLGHMRDQLTPVTSVLQTAIERTKCHAGEWHSFGGIVVEPDR